MKSMRGQSHDANIVEATVGGLPCWEIALEKGAEITAYSERRQLSIPYIFATGEAIGVGKRTRVETGTSPHRAHGMMATNTACTLPLCSTTTG